MNRPKVSVIIPTYNRAESYLTESVESVLLQTYENTEIIVVNDGSTDNTKEVLTPYLKYIRYIERENGGCAAAKNTGLKLATGDFITNLDDDDRIHPEKIERQVEAFQANPDLGLCATSANIIDAKGYVVDRFTPPRWSKKTLFIQFARRCPLVQSSVLINRKCHEQLGNYKNTHSQDRDFWHRVILHGYEIVVIREPLTDYRIHGNQIIGERHRAQVKTANQKITREFVEQVPIDRFIPGIRSLEEGHVIRGLLLAEQQLFDAAEKHLNEALPSDAGVFGLLLSKMYQRQFDTARDYAMHLRQKKSRFAPHLEAGLQLMTRMEAVIEKSKAYTNESKEVVLLRADLSRFQSRILTHLLNLATR